MTYLLLIWDTWGGVSRSPCRRVVDTYWHLCGQPFFLPVSHILLKILGLPPVFFGLCFSFHFSLIHQWLQPGRSNGAYILIFFSNSLKDCWLFAVLAPSGRLFQCSTVRTANEYFRMSVLANGAASPFAQRPSCTDSIVSACCCEQFFASAIADEFVHKAHVLLDSSGLQCLKAKFCTSFLITFSFKARDHAYSTAFFCTFSSTSRSPASHGDQAWEANSRCGLTYCL